MIKSLFILGFIACLTGTSLCGMDDGFRKKAKDNYDAYDEYKGDFRMGNNDYGEAESEFNDAYDTRIDSGAGRLLKDAANEMKTSPVPSKTSDKPSTTSSLMEKINPNDPGQINNNKFALFLNVSGMPGSLLQKQNKNKAVTIRYYLFKKRDPNMYVFDEIPNVILNEDVYFLVHGHMQSKNKYFKQEDYVMEFYKSISIALLEKKDCSVVGLVWSFKEPSKPDSSAEYKAAIEAGKMFGNDINNLREKEHYKKGIFIISHDLGNVLAASVSLVVKKPVNLIYGLDQRPFPLIYRNYYLRQDSAELVVILTTNGMKYNYGHRNFYPNGGNTTQAFYLEDKCFFCQSYRLLSVDIMQSGNIHVATFCTSFDDYFMGRCKTFPKVSYFDESPAKMLPLGNYFTTEDIVPPFIDNEGEDGKGDIWGS